MNVEIRRIQPADYKWTSEIVCRNFREINVKDYSEEAMAQLCDIYTPEKIQSIAEFAHMYVACIDGQVVGCGAIHSFWGKLDESMLRTIFVQPEYHGQGLGRKIVLVLEEDEYFKRAKRIEVPASITAHEFYLSLGYQYKNGVKELDDEDHFRMEKFNCNQQII